MSDKLPGTPTFSTAANRTTSGCVEVHVLKNGLSSLARDGTGTGSGPMAVPMATGVTWESTGVGISPGTLATLEGHALALTSATVFGVPPASVTPVVS